MLTPPRRRFSPPPPFIATITVFRNHHLFLGATVTVRARRKQSLPKTVKEDAASCPAGIFLLKSRGKRSPESG